jgi:hypothetical protein
LQIARTIGQSAMQMIGGTAQRLFIHEVTQEIQPIVKAQTSKLSC